MLSTLQCWYQPGGSLVHFFPGVDVAGTVYRIGLPLDSMDSRVSPGCAEPMDALGDHALSCYPFGIYNRHDELRNKFALLCKDLGVQVELEKGPEGSILRPADALVPGLDVSPVAIDFSVKHTLQAPLADTRWKVRQADGKPKKHPSKCILLAFCKLMFRFIFLGM